MKKARLNRSIPPERYRLSDKDALPPKAGDEIELDQGYSGPNGEPMYLAYMRGSNGGFLCEMDVYETELEP